MKGIDIIIVVLAILFVIGVGAYSVWKKKTGKFGCGCGCENCKMDCAARKSEQKTKEKKDA